MDPKQEPVAPRLPAVLGHFIWVIVFRRVSSWIPNPKSPNVPTAHAIRPLLPPPRLSFSPALLTDIFIDSFPRPVALTPLKAYPALALLPHILAFRPALALLPALALPTRARALSSPLTTPENNSRALLCRAEFEAYQEAFQHNISDVKSIFARLYPNMEVEKQDAHSQLYTYIAILAILAIGPLSVNRSVPPLSSAAARWFLCRMYKYCKCPFVVGEHALTQDHVNWVRQKQRERAQERPLNTNDLVRQTMRISLADSDTDPTLSDRPSGGADILWRARLQTQTQAGHWNEQSDDLLRAILRDIEAAIRPLDPARIASLNLDLQWQAVDTAAEELAISAKALQAFDEETEEKAFVTQDPTTTIADPMANIDIVAQLMVLLGLVCNLIMNMSRNSVEFILRVVTMMIKYTMLIPPSKPQKAPDNESYTDMQQHIIDQLPTSFHDAMSKLNLDGKTVLYAACPSCEHVHAPTLSTSKEPT
ncbi:hypothetical protein C8R44DRAFT_896226 [Mycena epipterygia]|nr:hypothetical protein C8R44DRAFT_896226 [Mycena epipterygia]